VLDAAEMVISELVTNAVRYGVSRDAALPGQTPIGLWLFGEAGELMCMVTDPGSEIPVPRESSPFSENGRGLHVVSAYSRRWGWNLLEEGGKAVWALLRIEKLWCAYRKVILRHVVPARNLVPQPGRIDFPAL
jgi:anti-sigma regulatory factor (Ser/Thr protein kinase)